MKNFKKAAAILGVILLLAAFCLPMIFAMGTGAESQSMFRASLAIVVILPVLVYAMMLMYRFLNKDKKKEEKESMITNVIFDVGRVLLGYDWEAYLKSYGFSQEKYEKIADATFRNKIWDERDRGLYEEEEYLRQFIAQAPEYEEDIRKVIADSWKTIYSLDYALTWVKYLKEQGYHLYILSNYSAYMLEHTRQKMDFLNYMDGVVFSCEVQELKPEAGIYKKLLSMYGLDPEKSVFIDDRKENCEGAQAFGIHTVQFTEFKQAAAELEKLGVK